MFVTPYDEIEEARKEVLGKIACLCVGMADTNEHTLIAMEGTSLLVLVNTHQVEPVRLLLTRLEELHFAIAECSKKPFISDITQSIQSQLCPSFL